MTFNYKTIQDIDIDKKTKHFLSFMRGIVIDHRKQLASYFEHNDLWYNNIISFLKIDGLLSEYQKFYQKILGKCSNWMIAKP